jgi:hypothetical protein
VDDESSRPALNRELGSSIIAGGDTVSVLPCSGENSVNVVMLICASAPFEFDDYEPVMVAGFIMKRTPLYEGEGNVRFVLPRYCHGVACPSSVLKESSADGSIRPTKPGERSGAWIKHRTNREQDFVIGDYIPGSHGFDALLVGVYENKRLIFVAKVKDGFVPRIRDEIFRQARRKVSW